MLLAALVNSSVCRIRRSENPEGSQRRADSDAGQGAGAQPAGAGALASVAASGYRLVAATVEL